LWFVERVWCSVTFQYYFVVGCLLLARIDLEMRRSMNAFMFPDNVREDNEILVGFEVSEVPVGAAVIQLWRPSCPSNKYSPILTLVVEKMIVLSNL
jgi:hypothetical protein